MNGFYYIGDAHEIPRSLAADIFQLSPITKLSLQARNAMS